MTFVQGVLASLIAGLLLSLLSSPWRRRLGRAWTLLRARVSRRARKAGTAVAARLTESDVEIVYRDRSDAQADLAYDVGRSSQVFLLTGRAVQLQTDDAFAHLFTSPGTTPRVDFRILLPLPMKPLGVDWTSINEKELAKLDRAYEAHGTLRNQIEQSRRLLETYERQGLVSVGYADLPHVGRIVITDHAAYFNPYSDSRHSRHSPVVKYRSGGVHHAALRRLFDLLWQHQPRDPSSGSATSSG